jgi:hypothetical protein
MWKQILKAPISLRSNFLEGKKCKYPRFSSKIRFVQLIKMFLWIKKWGGANSMGSKKIGVLKFLGSVEVGKLNW